MGFLSDLFDNNNTQNNIPAITAKMGGLVGAFLGGPIGAAIGFGLGCLFGSKNKK